MSKAQDAIDSLFAKGAEFYQCARHMNARGMRDVMNEAAQIVGDLKRDGHTFEDVLKYGTELNGGEPIDVSADKFLQRVQKIFEDGAG
jgi:urease gamma subunit